MTIKIGSTTFDKYGSISVSLIYDSVASIFSAEVYFDTANSAHKKALQPGLYPRVTIEHNGNTLFTGTLLTYRFKSSARKHLVVISGYSTPGVFEDCNILTKKPIQTSGLSLTEIARELISPFGVRLIVDDSVADVCSKPIPSINPDSTQTIKSYLSEIASQINVVVSHTADGDLLFTGYKTKQASAPYLVIPNNLPGEKNKEFIYNEGQAANRASVFTFTQGQPGVEYDLIFDGQRMHSDISVVAQQSVQGSDATTTPVLINPYVDRSRINYLGVAFNNTIGNPENPKLGFRPKVAMLTAGTQADKAQRNILSEELKSIPLIIDMQGWELNGKIAKPGDIISITNPELHLYKPASFFILTADYKADERSQTARLYCVLPEVFNNDVPKNIFA